MPIYAGRQTEAEWQRIREQIARVAADEVRAGRELTTGVIVGGVVTKQFPEDALPGQPTRAAFVANVRLLDFPGQPLVRDVLVANGARQLVGDSDGTPVLLKMDPTGRLQIIGRAAVSTENREIVLCPVYDVDGHDLSFVFGMSSTTFGSLGASVKSGINSYRATLGLPALLDGAVILVDPSVFLHGENYLPGYVDALTGVRGGAGGGSVCNQITRLVPWNDSRWKWGSTPTGWAAGTSSWALRETTTVCT